MIFWVNSILILFIISLLRVSYLTKIMHSAYYSSFSVFLFSSRSTIPLIFYDSQKSLKVLFSNLGITKNFISPRTFLNNSGFQSWPKLKLIESLIFFSSLLKKTKKLSFNYCYF